MMDDLNLVIKRSLEGIERNFDEIQLLQYQLLASFCFHQITPFKRGRKRGGEKKGVVERDGEGERMEEEGKKETRPRQAKEENSEKKVEREEEGLEEEEEEERVQKEMVEENLAVIMNGLSSKANRAIRDICWTLITSYIGVDRFDVEHQQKQKKEDDDHHSANNQSDQYRVELERKRKEMRERKKNERRRRMEKVKSYLLYKIHSSISNGELDFVYLKDLLSHLS
eukprot:TRINITY_DN11042_c0_g1_i1.p1 TRINITY_DN11042_c0_g1~~TRINITY_DN11042_c0_g1_i1.p1  ORF type:complete len:226 (+),score=85.58 TRINITY_DN11042_c0_g1_i1:125-802(+)